MVELTVSTPSVPSLKGPQRLLLKLPPPAGTFIGKLVEESKAFEKEIHVYNELELYPDDEDGRRLFPRAFLTSSANFPETSSLKQTFGQFILMEDMREEGFFMVDKRTGLSSGQVSCAVKTLARFHAYFLAQNAQHLLAHQEIGNTRTFLKLG
jgi:hypothetical protein